MPPAQQARSAQRAVVLQSHYAAAMSQLFSALLCSRPPGYGSDPATAPPTTTASGSAQPRRTWPHSMHFEESSASSISTPGCTCRERLIMPSTFICCGAEAQGRAAAEAGVQCLGSLAVLCVTAWGKSSGQGKGAAAPACWESQTCRPPIGTLHVWLRMRCQACTLDGVS